MNKSKWKLFVIILFSLAFSKEPANAASLFSVEFFGSVSSAVATSLAGPPKASPALVGESFSAIVEVETGVPSPVGYAALSVNLSNTGDFLVPIPSQTETGASYFGPSTFNGSSGSIPGFTFIYTAGSPLSDILTAQILVDSVDRADDNGVLTLTLQTTQAFGPNSVSPVPLPPSLPMFASALLVLGIFGFCARRKHGPPSFAAIS
jgi:hypothetical protein